MERNPEFMDEWHYEIGVMLKGFNELYERTGEEEYWDYIKMNMDRFVQPDGGIRTYTIDEYNVDNITPGKLLFPLYEATGDERYRRAADTLREQLHGHPRTSEGGFWHKKIYPHQLWLDGVYMLGPFLARYGQDFDEPEAIDEVAKEILLVARYMRDPATGLYYHGWDESRQQRWADNRTGLSENFWGRGMGWYGMALVDALDYIPEDHPDRGAIISVLQQYAEAVSNVQDPVTGLWYQILDKPTRAENYLEASVSSMFTYTLVKGVRKGYLDDEYLAVARRAYEGILDEFIEVTDEGLVNLCCTVTVGGLGGDPYRDGTFKYYMSEPLRVNDNKGVGPFIMASLQLEAIEE
jgi:unsaturated rhamnogalacturonyl hydrolase